MPWIEKAQNTVAETLNIDYCPTVVRHLGRILIQLHELTGLLSEPQCYAYDCPENEKAFGFRHGQRHITNAAVEAWHKFVKQDILLNETNVHPCQFVLLLESAVHEKFFELHNKLTQKFPVTTKGLRKPKPVRTSSDESSKQLQKRTKEQSTSGRESGQESERGRESQSKKVKKKTVTQKAAEIHHEKGTEKVRANEAKGSEKGANMQEESPREEATAEEVEQLAPEKVQPETTPAQPQTAAATVARKEAPICYSLESSAMTPPHKGIVGSDLTPCISLNYPLY